MVRIPTMSISMRELDRLKCIQAVIDGDLKPGRAAERLGLTVRQIERLVVRYRAEGPIGLISRHRNRPGNRGLKAPLVEHVLSILREHYADFGPTLAAEKLRARHKIILAKETVRRIQIAAGLWLPRKLRPPRIQQPRMRRSCIGELIQIDGCEHRWFEERAPACTVLVYVDDATRRLMEILFTGSESTFGYFEATRRYLERHGKPLAFYSDKASVFRINNKSATGGDGHTQFGRVLYELNIDGICAGISTIEAANAFMPAFIDEHNEKFAKSPRNAHDAHRAIRKDEDLDLIFSWRELRKLTQNLTLHYERKLYMLKDTPAHRQLIGKYLDVYQYPDGRIEIRTAGVSIPYSEFDKLGELDQGQIVENKRLGHVLQAVQIVQAQRDNRVLSAPSTAHRQNGRLSRVRKTPGTKTQRQLNVHDLAAAIASTVKQGSAGRRRSS